MSGVPSAIEGTAGMFEVIPIFRAKLITGRGPTKSIIRALTVLTEFAKAFFKVRVCPYLSPEFFGHQASIFPCFIGSIQYKASGSESQGESLSWSMAVAYKKGLNVEPICRLPCFT